VLRDQGPENGLYRRGRRRSHRFRAWKPDLILSVAQRHAGLSWPGPADCLRHDRDGRFRETSRLWPRPLHLRRAAQFSVRAVEKLGVDRDVVFVLHDWGSLLGFDWTRQHAEGVQGIAYMEALVQPITWADWPENERSIFQGFRSKDGETMVLQKNMFVENLLPGAILRRLSNEEMAAYRAPFANAGEDRRPTLTWPRQIPIEGEPPEVVRVATDCGRWLAESRIPKLFINAEPGAILTGRQREFCRRWPNQKEITVKGVHFVQEDSPSEIGLAVADFVRDLRAGSQ